MRFRLMKLRHIRTRLTHGEGLLNQTQFITPKFICKMSKSIHSIISSQYPSSILGRASNFIKHIWLDSLEVKRGDIFKNRVDEKLDISESGIAQLVERQMSNLCVPSSILGTINIGAVCRVAFGTFLFNKCKGN